MKGGKKISFFFDGQPSHHQERPFGPEECQPVKQMTVVKQASDAIFSLDV
jgi:hypothetical protein